MKYAFLWVFLYSSFSYADCTSLFNTSYLVNKPLRQEAALYYDDVSYDNLSEVDRKTIGTLKDKLYGFRSITFITDKVPSRTSYSYDMQTKAVTQARFTDSSDNIPTVISAVDYIGTLKQAFYITYICTIANGVRNLSDKVFSPIEAPFTAVDYAHLLAISFVNLAIIPAQENEISLSRIHNFKYWTPRVIYTDRTLIIDTLRGIELAVNKLSEDGEITAVRRFFQTLNETLFNKQVQGPRITRRNFSKLVNNLVPIIEGAQYDNFEVSAVNLREAMASINPRPRRR